MHLFDFFVMSLAPNYNLIARQLSVFCTQLHFEFPAARRGNSKCMKYIYKNMRASGLQTPALPAPASAAQREGVSLAGIMPPKRTVSIEAAELYAEACKVREA